VRGTAAAGEEEVQPRREHQPQPRVEWDEEGGYGGGEKGVGLQAQNQENHKDGEREDPEDPHEAHGGGSRGSEGLGGGGEEEPEEGEEERAEDHPVVPCYGSCSVVISCEFYIFENSFKYKINR